MSNYGLPSLYSSVIKKSLPFKSPPWLRRKDPRFATMRGPFSNPSFSELSVNRKNILGESGKRVIKQNNFFKEEKQTPKQKQKELPLWIKSPAKPFYSKETNSYLLPDFVEIQRKSFFQLLKNGLIEEFSKRNPITNKNLELFFYPEFYQLTPPEYNPRRAILISKSYSSKLYIPVQLTDKKLKKSQLKWVLIGNLPLMTKRGHFVLNGSPRVIVNQILRSPGIYFQGSLKEIYPDQWSEKPDLTYKRFYTDLICLRGTWLRIEIDKNKDIWAQMKKVPKIPLLWFLLAMGLTERIIFKSILNPTRLLANFDLGIKRKIEYEYVSNPSDAWKQISKLISSPTLSLSSSIPVPQEQKLDETKKIAKPAKTKINDSQNLTSPPSKKEEEKTMFSVVPQNQLGGVLPQSLAVTTMAQDKSAPLSFLNIVEQSKEGRNWIFKRFMNPRAYDLGIQGRLNLNRKLGLTLPPNQSTLTAQDLLYATDHLFKVEKGLLNVDDIDHLKNRRVRTSGELLQIQIGIGLVRLEKMIRDKFVKINAQRLATGFLTSKPNKVRPNKVGPRFQDSKKNVLSFKRKGLLRPIVKQKGVLRSLWLIKKVPSNKISSSKNYNWQAPETKLETKPKNNKVKKSTSRPLISSKKIKVNKSKSKGKAKQAKKTLNIQLEEFKMANLINTKAFNGALREFFGSSPLSQFMDQLNPLAEITHKRRLSSMGPGGVTRDSATLAIRGIHPTHYGRICPIETPEGKNTGLVNSLTTYARINPQGFLESPFYKVYKGQIQNNAFGGMYYLSAEQEEKIKLAAADVAAPSGRIGFLPKSQIPAKIAYGDTISKISRNVVEYIGVSPIQMISIATSLIPFLEHDDANRALMGSNMQRQAVPLVRPERPLVGTGLESRAVSDSGHAIVAKESGYVAYVSAKKMVIYSIPMVN